MATPGLFQDFNPASRIASNQKGTNVGYAPNKQEATNNRITRGTLIAFHYPISYAKEPYIIHDSHPMVIITDIWPTFLRGVNLHYLTFPYIKQILQGHCNNNNYSWRTVKSDKYIAGAFRMYSRAGIKQVKKMDCSWLLDVLGAVRSFSESELQKLQEQIQAQIQAKLQAKAKELTSYEDFRNTLVANQKRALDRKVGEVKDIVRGGLDRDLIRSNPSIMSPDKISPNDMSSDETKI